MSAEHARPPTESGQSRIPEIQVPMAPSHDPKLIITVMRGVPDLVDFPSLEEMFNYGSITWAGKPLAVLHEKVAGQPTNHQSLENIELNLLDARARAIGEQAQGRRRKELLVSSARHSLVQAQAYGYEVLERASRESLAQLGDKESKNWFKADAKRRTIKPHRRKNGLSIKESAVVFEEKDEDKGHDSGMLTPTHRAVMERLAEGKNIEQIAEEMGRNVANIEELVAEVQAKMNPSTKS